MEYLKATPEGYKDLSRVKFYFDKIRFLITFICHREWDLVRSEWNMTYDQLNCALARWEELEEEAAKRLLKLLED